MRFVLLMSLLGACTGFTKAEPITFVIAGTADGVVYQDLSLANGVSFSGQPFSFTLTTDTDLIGSFLGIPTTPMIHNTGISVGGDSGVIDFSTAIWGESFDLEDPSIFPVLSWDNPSLTSYGLTTPVGPVDIDATFNPGGHLTVYYLGTSFGIVNFTGVSNVTFAATIAPEPASIGFILAGLAALFVGRRFLPAS